MKSTRRLAHSAAKRKTTRELRRCHPPARKLRGASCRQTLPLKIIYNKININALLRPGVPEDTARIVVDRDLGLAKLQLVEPEAHPGGGPRSYLDLRNPFC